MQKENNIQKAINLLTNRTYMVGGKASLGPGIRRKYRLRRNRNSRIFQELNYQNSTKPQSLGVGRSELNIEKLVSEANLNTQKYIKIGEILTGSLEFVQKMTTYRYFKIVGLAVVFEPNFNSSPERVYLQVNWDGNETDNMQYEDSTKIVPQYRNRRMVFKFIPPNLTVIDNGGYFNYKSWIVRSIYNTNAELPGNIILKCSAGNNQVNCRIVLRVWFAGSVIQSLSKTIEIATSIDKNSGFLDSKQEHDAKKQSLNDNLFCIKEVEPHKEFECTRQGSPGGTRGLEPLSLKYNDKSELNVIKSRNKTDGTSNGDLYRAPQIDRFGTENNKQVFASDRRNYSFNCNERRNPKDKSLFLDSLE